MWEQVGAGAHSAFNGVADPLCPYQLDFEDLFDSLEKAKRYSYLGPIDTSLVAFSEESTLLLLRNRYCQTAS